MKPPTIVLASLLLSVASAVGSAQQTRPQAISDAQQDRFVAMLEAYGNGRPMTLEIGSFAAFREALERFGRPWVDNGPPEDRIRRRRTLALAALDGAVARLPRELGQLTTLLEWACQVLSRDRPSDFERTWMLASINFAELLSWRGLNLFVTEEPCPVDWVCGHGAHAVARFPDDSRFKAALVFARREVKVLTKRPLGSVRALLTGSALTAMTTAPPSRKETDRLANTFSKLRHLTNDPVVGPLTRLRLGILHYEMRQFGDSRRELGLVLRTSTDLSTIYLAHLVLGLGFDSEGKTDDARRSFEAAVAADPGILSGALELASHRFAAGQYAEGSALITRALSSPTRQDPWQWSCGDCPDLTQQLAQLRAGVVR